MDRRKEYYTEELEKPIKEKIRALNNQRYYTTASIIFMFVVLISMYFLLG